MKKSIIKMMSLILTVLTVMSLSLPTFAAGAHAKPKAEPLTPTEDTTWGDICRHFNPEWFQTLPVEVQKQYDELLYLANTNATDSSRAGALKLGIDLNSTSSSIAYNGGLTLSISAPDMESMALTLALYDAETNTLIDSDNAVETNTRMCTLTGAFFDLERSHRYRVDSIGIAVPPPGYTVSPVSGSNFISTK